MNIQAIRERLEKATTGTLEEKFKNTYEFATHAPEDIRDLLDEVERLHAKLEDYEDKRNSVQVLSKQVVELQAANGELRGALENARIEFCDKFKNRKNHSTICYPPWGEICEELENCKAIEKSLSSTPAELYARLKALEEVAEAANKIKKQLIATDFKSGVTPKEGLSFKVLFDALARLDNKTGGKSNEL
jgi:DNA repair exonuclease SbcCD ATPase subunit